MSKTVLAIALGVLTLIPMLRATADHHEEGKHPEIANAVCSLRATKGNKVRGMLRLTQKDGFVLVQGRVNNLTPGSHGFHIHQFGDLRGGDGKAAGGHYAGKGHKHGGPHSAAGERHAGDLGNIEANEKGVAKVNIKAKGLSLYMVLGRSFVVHGGTDDLKSQPSGAAGPRVSVGVIGLAAPPAKKK